MPLPRLAKVNVKVHQSRANDPPGRINRFRAFGRMLHNPALLNCHICKLIAPSVGVDYPAAAEHKCLLGLHRG
jgi:hypothetical protein